MRSWLRRTTVATLLLAACGAKMGTAPTGDAAVEAPAPPSDDASGVDKSAPGDVPDGHAGADTGATNPFTIAVESFCRQKALKVCAREVACAIQPVSEARCSAMAEADCRAEIDAGPAHSAAAGRLKIDQAAFARCLAALDRIQCSGGFYQVAPQCLRLFTGMIADGQPCINRHECAGGICKRTDRCLGTCASYGAVGAECGVPNTNGCDPVTTFCDLATHKCAAVSAAGACQGGLDPSCVAGSYCESGRDLSCQLAVSGPSEICQCVPLRTVGSACRESEQCQPGLVCAANKCRAPGKLGELCDLNANAYCEPGLACIPKVNSVGTCGPRVPEGSKCVSECQVGFTCVPDDPDAGVESGTCRPLAKLGQACSTNVGCVEGARCDQTGKCVAETSCPFRRDIPCAGGLPVGAQCSISTDCASFVCLQQKCVAACSVADL